MVSGVMEKVPHSPRGRNTSETTASIPVTTPITPRQVPSGAGSDPLSRTPRIGGESSMASIGSSVGSFKVWPPSSRFSQLSMLSAARKPSAGSLAGGGENADVMPQQFYDSHISEVATLVAKMLSEIVEINDRIPFDADRLTRFHSRAPPGISIRDYLVRIIRFCSLDKVILIVLLHFIDLFSQCYANFNINTLTVHRFIITGVTVASKGLCDAYCENTFYAKVGGITHVELNLLEVEFLTRVNYRIVPRPGLLAQYYTRMLDRQRTAQGTNPPGPEPFTAGIQHSEDKSPKPREDQSVTPTTASQAVDAQSEEEQEIPATKKHARSNSPLPVHAEPAKPGIKSAVRKLLHPAKKKRAYDSTF